MTIAGTYLSLQNRIAEELNSRSDLKSPILSGSAINSPIKRAIQSAIAKWESEPFFFTEVYNTSFFTTTTSQEYYTSSDAAAIATLVNISRLHTTVAGSRLSLIRRDWNYLDDISTSTSIAPPQEFAYFAQQIRLYPIPNGAYVIAWSGNQRLTALSADADSNGWTTYGFDLIRCEALMIIATELLHDANLAAAMEQAIYGHPEKPNLKGYLQALREETMRRSRPGMLRAAGDPPRGG